MSSGRRRAMWLRSVVITGFCGILCVANGCAVTSGCGGCGEDGCGEVCGPADFACGGVNPHDLPPLTGHLPGCGCDAVGVPGCAAPAAAGCGCNGLVTADVTCAAPGDCAACPTCAAPFASTAAIPYQQNMAPNLAPAATAAPVPSPSPLPPAMAPQSVYPPPLQGVPVQNYSSGIPLGVPAPSTPAASAPAASAPAASDSPAAGAQPSAVPQPDDFDPEEGFGSDARYYQPRAIRPVNAVPMGNGYYIQQQGAQVPVRRGQRLPVRRVQQTSGQRDEGLKTFYLD